MPQATVVKTRNTHPETGAETRRAPVAPDRSAQALKRILEDAARKPAEFCASWTVPGGAE